MSTEDDNIRVSWTMCAHFLFGRLTFDAALDRFREELKHSRHEIKTGNANMRDCYERRAALVEKVIPWALANREFLEQECLGEIMAAGLQRSQPAWNYLPEGYQAKLLDQLPRRPEQGQLL